MWKARTKTDLIIEVWEKLDCESIGEDEIGAIETAVRAEYGEKAVDSPMVTARLLADEGAELRHDELMKLHVKSYLDSPYAPMFRNIFNVSGFSQTLSSINSIENLRKKFANDSDKEGLRLIKEKTIEIKTQALATSMDQNISARVRAENAEIAEWLALWLQSPEVFENWVKLRQNSLDFKKKFSAEATIEQDVF